MSTGEENVESFDTWFGEQYGTEPFPECSLGDLDDEVIRARHRLRTAENRRGARLDWITRRDAALKGWCARPKP